MDFDYKINKTGLSSKLFMHGPITNNNIIYKTTQEEKIYNLGEVKPAVIKTYDKTYMFIGIASIILIIILNNK